MAVLKKYNLDGAVVGEISVDESLFEMETNPQMVKDYIVALRANARQWSASTKGRSEVNHSTRKPFRQKGTGNARQGTLAAPQFRGGGEVFGPKPKFNQHVRINRKERRQVILQLLIEKLRNDKILVLGDDELTSLQEPKTKKVAKFLSQLSLRGRRVLFVGEGTYETIEFGTNLQDEELDAVDSNDGFIYKFSVASDKHRLFKLSVRNLERIGFALAPNVNGYEVAASHAMIVTESAWKEMLQNLGYDNNSVLKNKVEE